MDDFPSIVHMGRKWRYVLLCGNAFDPIASRIDVSNNNIKNLKYYLEYCDLTIGAAKM